MVQKIVLSALLLIFAIGLQSVSGQQQYNQYDAPPPNGYDYPSYSPPNGAPFPNANYPPTGSDYYPPQSYPAQSYPAQSYPAQSYPAQSYPAQSYPTPGYPGQEFDQYRYHDQPSFGPYNQDSNPSQPAEDWYAADDSCAECQGACSGNCRPGNGKCGCRSCNQRPQPDCRDCNWGPSYLGFFGGAGFIDNLDTRRVFDIGVPNTLGVEEFGFSTESSGAIGGSIGRYFYRRLRVELEYTYRVNDFDEANRYVYEEFTPLPMGMDDTPSPFQTLISSESTPVDGTLNSHSFLANWVFDLKPRAIGCFNGYLGGGIGALYADGMASTATDVFTIDDTAFAYQGIGGINYPIRERIDLFAEYRYLGANELKASRTNDEGTQNLGSFRFDSHNVFFGIRLLK